MDHMKKQLASKITCLCINGWSEVDETLTMCTRLFWFLCNHAGCWCFNIDARLLLWWLILKQVRCFLDLFHLFLCVRFFITCSLWCCRRTFCMRLIISFFLTRFFNFSLSLFSISVSVCIRDRKANKRVNYDTRWGYWRPTRVAITHNALAVRTDLIMTWKIFRCTYEVIAFRLQCCCDAGTVAVVLLAAATPSFQINAFIN